MPEPDLTTARADVTHRAGAPPLSRDLSRRGFLRAAGVVGAGLALGACARTSASEPTEIVFFQSKPEVIGYFDELIEQFHQEQSRVRVRHDATSNLAGSFVRESPPDIGCLNYNFEISRYVERGVLSDLGDLPEAGRVLDELHPLIDVTASYPGRTSVLPYSLMAAAVLYNREIFAQQGLTVPTTWDELVAVCDALRAAGITPIYSTFKDPWTIAQGHFDYTVGGMVDTTAFFDQLKQQGTEVGPGSPVAFQKQFLPPVERMQELVAYVNDDAASRGYGDGNLAFADGQAAMYLQGPWAIGEIVKTNPDLDVGAFPLPMTDDPADRKVRVNVDLALWIPEGSTKKAAAREFLQFLMRPDVIDAYNAHALGFGVTKDAAPVTNSTLVELKEYYDRADFYLGASQLVPQSIPLQNYTQSLAAGAAPEPVLRTLDADWRRLAFRS
ncbi:ABC transporter substrate-binding protein [Cellulomonas fimi]|uniref:Extracellular solute-binding protein family 1 n=1 Tax=Cellulomonas fimi (strain ATCC 484 / DSM 20113 / JCM 1341 / CCUG 24087 / LMG 16345 / NBRC 15513 / NCIMB 8980 / NCTC 7547 / NRS-133) TaxID=590998 RepID=F4H2R0_CELFA|nr:substrate-binding domain-containing protein [Cellulomonas fimi]AEE46409.1 extracellular solute-binding protein family 1 [Cellulomonas fimi ATCC 484]VEH32881.1 P39 [Cellulomonas fimi]